MNSKDFSYDLFVISLGVDFIIAKFVGSGKGYFFIPPQVFKSVLQCRFVNNVEGLLISEISMIIANGSSW